MRTRMKWCSLVIIKSMLFAAVSVFAEGKARGRGDKPPGWKEGEKKGWQGDVPLESKRGVVGCLLG